MVATVKIIPLCVARRRRWRKRRHWPPAAIGIEAYSSKRIGVVRDHAAIAQAQRDGQDDPRAGGAAGALRLASSSEIRTGHDEAGVAARDRRAAAAKRYRAGVRRVGDLRHRRCHSGGDPAPAGGIEHFGMPVDPGNLMLLGEVGEQAGDRRARLRAQPDGERLRLDTAAPDCRAEGDALRRSPGLASAAC